MKKKGCPPNLIKDPISGKCVKNILFYHGTSDIHLEKIKKQGLKNPYLTRNIDIAEYCAVDESEEKGGAPVLLKIRIDRTDEQHLMPDNPMYEEPLSYILNKWNMTEDEWVEDMCSENTHVPLPKNDNDWATSLKAVDSICHRGIIPYKKISVEFV